MTLVEVMIVIAILVVLAALAVPIINSSLSGSRLRKAADSVRAEWAGLRIQAMEEGQILCFRCSIDGNEILIDRVLDIHYAAALSTSGSEDGMDAADTYRESEDSSYGFGSAGFTGSEDDFILRDPSLATEDSGARKLTLVGGAVFADALAVPDERTAYLLGNPVEDMETSRGAGDQSIKNQDARYGQAAGRDGQSWSAPIFFFPDGTTSTAAVLLRNEEGDRCLEVRLRGLTGSTSVTEIRSQDNYTGEMIFQQ